MEKRQLNKEARTFINSATNPFKFYMGMLSSLPSIIFWGVRIAELNEHTCSITIPYGWRTRNPFKSIYFAALAGAGELSTGALCRLAITGKGKWSMLVTSFKAEYSKKATTKITFTCDGGSQIFDKVEALEQSGEAGEVDLVSIGKNTEGEEVARIYITWSLRKKLG